MAGIRKNKTLSAQDSIAYQEMGKDGICRVQGNIYSKTIQFWDINYKLAKVEDQQMILERWSEFLNYFDSSIHFQITFENRKSKKEEFQSVIRTLPRGEAFEEIRQEYEHMLREQLSKGNHGQVKTKYITFSIEAGNIHEARRKLERIEADVLNNFKVIGVPACALDGTQRLKILYEIFHPDANVPFQFEYEQLHKTGLSTKDFVAPTSFTFKERTNFWMGDTVGRASYLQLFASELTDEILMDLLDMDKNFILNIHLQPVDQTKALKMVKSKLTDINRMKIDEQKKAVRAGYDMDILPSDLVTYADDAKNLQDDLQQKNDRLFLTTIEVLNTASSKKQLDTAVFQTAGIAQKHNCNLRCLDYMQEDGLMSSLPLGINHIPIERALPTKCTAILVPFTTQELFMPGESLYYGLNAISNNMIMADRKRLKNPNGLILGKTGSGKSFAAKREITNAFFVTDDDIIITDPEAEYFPLVQALGGQVIEISSSSTDYINPMDINMDYAEDDNPLAVKSDFILSLCELILNRRNGIEPEERSVIDRCLPFVYQKYFEDPCPENMPILGDLYELLLKQSEPEAQNIATALEIYVNGSLNVFNHRSNIQMDKHRVLCFQLKSLGKALKEIGLLIMQDAVWNRVTANRSKHKTTWFYIDEFHLLLKGQTGSFSVEIWKRFRKWGGIPSGLTQNVKDLLASREIENIFENSDFIYMLNQAQGDRQILAKQLGISPHQLSYVTHSGPGEGLLFFGNVIIPFVDHFPKDTLLYSVLTTRPDEVAGTKA